jgi:RNA polymerase sigma-70 factor, ECF subfamily
MSASPTVSTPLSPERSTFSEVYDQHFSYVWQLLRRTGIPERDRHDIAHEVFVTAWRRLDVYDRSRPLRPWLGGIAFREAVAYLRRASTTRESLGISTEVEDSCLGPESLGIESQMRGVVRKALESVAMEKRKVLVMHDLQEIPMAEIARGMSIPLMTAYSRLRLARRDLRSALWRLRAQWIETVKGSA